MFLSLSSVKNSHCNINTSKWPFNDSHKWKLSQTRPIMRSWRSRRDRLETRRRRIWLRGASPLVLLYLCRRMTGMFHCTYQNMHVTSPGFSFTRGVRGLVLPYQPAAVCRTRCETEVKVGADIWSTAQKHRRSAAQWSGGTDVFSIRWSGSEQTNRSVNDDEKPQSKNTRRI